MKHRATSLRQQSYSSVTATQLLHECDVFSGFFLIIQQFCKRDVSGVARICVEAGHKIASPKGRRGE